MKRSKVAKFAAGVRLFQAEGVAGLVRQVRRVTCPHAVVEPDYDEAGGVCCKCGARGVWMLGGWVFR